ncbi:alpha/beta fold hydrolase [Prochlorococcus marinus]|uniref:alpha/beta fold hydrolase n=1 Tax=Prochlorococcus marinus TaxID=1219 RepID=UPI0022B5CB3B|nr:alpha/beta fold hydrolase [Prochlorococcus marinus]
MNANQAEANDGIASQNIPNWGEQHFWNWNGLFCHWRLLGEENQKSIILLHGFGASSSHWRYNASFLAENGFKVYGLDLIGFGKSEQPSQRKLKKLDNIFWANQVAAFVKEIVFPKNDEKVVLLGNSLGGLTALTTAACHPNLVKAVIAAPLPDPALIQDKFLTIPKWLLKIKNFFIKTFFNFLPLRTIVRFIIKTKLIDIAIQSAYSHSVKNDFDLKQIILEPAKRYSAGRVLRSMCIGMSTRDEISKAPSLLSRIASFPKHMPILIIWGSEDKFVPLRIGKKLIKDHSWLQLSIIERTGHCPHDESPKNFNQYVLHWLKNNLEGYI